MFCLCYYWVLAVAFSYRTLKLVVGLDVWPLMILSVSTYREAGIFIEQLLVHSVFVFLIHIVCYTSSNLVFLTQILSCEKCKFWSFVFCVSLFLTYIHLSSCSHAPSVFDCPHILINCSKKIVLYSFSEFITLLFSKVVLSTYLTVMSQCTLLGFLWESTRTCIPFEGWNHLCMQ
jgi:hypothetical protein